MWLIGGYRWQVVFFIDGSEVGFTAFLLDRCGVGSLCGGGSSGRQRRAGDDGRERRQARQIQTGEWIDCAVGSGIGGGFAAALQISVGIAIAGGPGDFLCAVAAEQTGQAGEGLREIGGGVAGVRREGQACGGAIDRRICSAGAELQGEQCAKVPRSCCGFTARRFVSRGAIVGSGCRIDGGGGGRGGALQ